MLKDKVKRFLISSRPGAQLIFAMSRMKNGQSMMNHSEERKDLDLFNLESLTRDIDYGPQELVIDNNLYGLGHCLRRYTGSQKPIQAYIEHGLFWGGMIHEDQKFWPQNKVVTFSSLRHQDILHHLPEKEVIEIGPYVHYAESIYPQKRFEELKKELGSVLLVFPSKSIASIRSGFDEDAFVQEIERKSKDFDSVLISLYFLDAKRKETLELYSSKGWKVVCSGHKYDQYFLDRQRTIIELADATMSNEVGTHIGYCLYLNKPHYLFEQTIERIGESEELLKRELDLYDSEEQTRRDQEKQEVASALKGNDQFITTEEQLNIVGKYWGFDSIKNPSELKVQLEINGA